MHVPSMPGPGPRRSRRQGGRPARGVLVLAVAIQFLLADLGVLGGESMEPHRQWAFIVLHLVPILMFIAAVIGRMGRTVIAPTAGLILLVFLQPLFADAELELG